MTEIERLARMLAERDGENPDDFHTRGAYESGDALPDHAFPLWMQPRYRGTVRAILRNIREPTEDIIMAGMENVRANTDESGVSPNAALECWQVMIDKLLAE